MTYESITQHNSPYFAPGNGRKPRSITVHWWDDPAKKPTFEGVIAWLTRPNTTASIHYVAEAGRVACLVDPDNIAWHAGDGGSGTGNLTSIGIEMNPRQTAGDYATVAELIRDLRKVYGDLPIVGHRNWTQTACPGTIDLQRLDRLARGTAAPAAPAAPKPAPAPRKGSRRWNVERGETLSHVAKYYGLPVAAIAHNNGISNPNRIEVGAQLVIPDGGIRVWTVDPGDTLGHIAKHYGVSVNAIASTNRITDPNRIEVGDVLQIP